MIEGGDSTLLRRLVYGLMPILFDSRAAIGGQAPVLRNLMSALYAGDSNGYVQCRPAVRRYTLADPDDDSSPSLPSLSQILMTLFADPSLYSRRPDAFGGSDSDPVTSKLAGLIGVCMGFCSSGRTFKVSKTFTQK